MNFNETQSKEIYEFIMEYNANEEFKNNIQEAYDNDTYKLPMLQIYALEEILRYGSKEIFNKFLETKGAYSVDQAVDLYDGFVKLLSKDINFKQYKMQQLKESPETLSALEMFAFTLISGSDNQEEQKEERQEEPEELEYDPYNPILYSTDNQIKETLENLLFGEAIHKMLEVPAMQSIKDRQKENGRIANIDKPFIIKEIQNGISENNYMVQFEQMINQRYVQAKLNILSGKGELAFAQYLRFNTNISSNEILGINRNNSEEDYRSFIDMFSKMKEEYDKKMGR